MFGLTLLAIGAVGGGTTAPHTGSRDREGSTYVVTQLFIRPVAVNVACGVIRALQSRAACVCVCKCHFLCVRAFVYIDACVLYVWMCMCVHV